MIIFGTRVYVRALAMVNFVCNNCHNPAAQRVLQRTIRFTLFFIPLFPIGKSYTTTCTFCGFSQRINKELAEQYAAGAQQPTGPVGPAREQIPGSQGPAQQYGQPPQFGQPQEYGQPQQYGRPEASPSAAPQQPQPGQQYGDPSAPQYPR